MKKKHVILGTIAILVSSTAFAVADLGQVVSSLTFGSDILKKLIDAPIAICDLSSRNPNVTGHLKVYSVSDNFSLFCCLRQHLDEHYGKSQHSKYPHSLAILG